MEIAVRKSRPVLSGGKFSAGFLGETEYPRPQDLAIRLASDAHDQGEISALERELHRIWSQQRPDRVSRARNAVEGDIVFRRVELP